MNALRAFCNAPSFQPDESELLQNVFSAGLGIRCAFLPRFDLVCEYDVGSQRALVSLFFSPPLRLFVPSSMGL